MGVCLICDPPRRVPDEKLLAHLREIHNQDIKVQTWPDGAAVVIDREEFTEETAA